MTLEEKKARVYDLSRQQAIMQKEIVQLNIEIEAEERQQDKK